MRCHVRATTCWLSVGIGLREVSVCRVTYSRLLSIPTECRRKLCATALVVQEPANGSRTQSPGSVNNLMNHSGSAFGNAAKLFRADGGEMQNIVWISQVSPNPVCNVLSETGPDLESKRTMSFLPRFFSLAFDQSPIGTRT